MDTHPPESCGAGSDSLRGPSLLAAQPGRTLCSCGDHRRDAPCAVDPRSAGDGCMGAGVDAEERLGSALYCTPWHVM